MYMRPLISAASIHENQTRDKQNILANIKSTAQNTSNGQLDKKCRFCLQEEKKKKNAFIELEERKKEATVKRIQLTCWITDTQKQNIKFWYSADFINCYHLISRTITWYLFPRKSYKDIQVLFIPEHDHVVSILNENLEHLRRLPIWKL